jgi:hypothetical protein
MKEKKTATEARTTVATITVAALNQAQNGGHCATF